MSHVLKTDDDMFINTDLLLEKLHSTDTFTFYGFSYKHSRRVLRHGTEPKGMDKWAIDVQIYNESFYPPYVSGGAYVFTGDVAQEVYYNALETTYFQIEDAFIGGFVRQVINATLIRIKYMFSYEYSPGDDMCNYMKYRSVHGLNSSELIDLYKHNIMEGKLCGIPNSRSFPGRVVADPGFPGPPR